MSVFRRSLPVLLLPLALSACAIQRAEILGPTPLSYGDASFLAPLDDEYFWIAPLAAGRHTPAPAAMQLPKAGVWVREGWLMVEFQCFTPSDRPEVKDPILPETDDQKPVFIHAGHRYELRCSPTKVGDIVLADQDDRTADPGG
jgi:hypothetical protein